MAIAKIICGILIALALYHFGVAIYQTGMADGVGTDVYVAGYFANPWQAVIDFDLVAGLTLAATWVWWREPDRATAFAWVAVLLYWGNLVVAIYVYRQLILSNGDWAQFFLGKRAQSIGAAGVVSRNPSLPLRCLLWSAAVAIAAFVINGCRSAGYAPAPVMGYVWGFGSLILPLMVLARTKTFAPVA